MKVLFFLFSGFLSKIEMLVQVSGVARAFPGGRAAHPEDQNEEEN